MRLLFVTLCVGACLVGDGAHAELSDITSRSACPPFPAGRCEIPTKRHLRVHEPINDDDERGFTTSAAESVASASKSIFGPKDIEGWLTTGISTDDVFKLLALDKAGNDILSNRNFATLDSFAKSFIRLNPRSQTALIETLTKKYGDEGLAKIIMAAIQVPNTARVARRLQKEQFLRWISRGQKPDEVFRMMKLDEAGDKLFEQPQVITWATFVKNYNKAYDTRLPYFNVFLSRYPAKTLTTMLFAAKEVPSTEKLAVKLLVEVTSIWLKKRKDPVSIFSILNLDHAEDNLFKSRLFIDWMRYLDAVEPKSQKGEKTSVLVTLKMTYPANVLQKMLDEADASPSFERLILEMEHDQHRRWFEQGTTLNEASEIVESANPSRAKLAGSALLRAVRSYPEYLTNQDVELVNWLLKGCNDPKTKDSSFEELKALLNRWALNQKDSKEVRDLLQKSKAKPIVITKLYDLYETMYNKYQPHMRDKKRKEREER